MKGKIMQVLLDGKPGAETCPQWGDMVQFKVLMFWRFVFFGGVTECDSSFQFDPSGHHGEEHGPRGPWRFQGVGMVDGLEWLDDSVVLPSQTELCNVMHLCIRLLKTCSISFIVDRGQSFSVQAEIPATEVGRLWLRDFGWLQLSRVRWLAGRFARAIPKRS